MARLTKDTLFKPTRMESKQSATDNVARSMIEAEAAARRKKTEKLRQLRLAAESDAEVPAVKPKAGKTKAGKKTAKSKS